MFECNISNSQMSFESTVFCSSRLFFYSAIVSMLDCIVKLKNKSFWGYSWFAKSIFGNSYKFTFVFFNATCPIGTAPRPGFHSNQWKPVWEERTLTGMLQLLASDVQCTSWGQGNGVCQHLASIILTFLNTLHSHSHSATRFPNNDIYNGKLTL